MKLKFESFFRGYLFLMVGRAALSVWRVMAQTRGTIEIVTPLDDARFNPGTNIVLRALTRMTPQRVEFLVHGQSIGCQQPAFAYTSSGPNVPAGTYEPDREGCLRKRAGVESAPVHVRVYNALLTFGLTDPILEVYKVLIFAVAVLRLVGLHLSRLLCFQGPRFPDAHLAEALGGKIETKFDDLLLDLLNGPVKIISFIIFLRIGLEVFQLAGDGADVFDQGVHDHCGDFADLYGAEIRRSGVGLLEQRRARARDRTFDEQLFPIIRRA